MQKMRNFDVIKQETKEHNPNWVQIPDYPQRTLIIAGLDLEKQIGYLI